MTKLPNDFLWGASTSAFQTEGAWNEDGKGPSLADTRSRKPDRANTEVAVDFYHRYREDIDLMEQCGLKSFRFSVAWSRIFPNGNDAVPNEQGLAFYDNVINALIEHRIEPIVTLFHFDLPEALLKQYGGWASRRIIDDFARYAKTVFERFGDRVRYWQTINEQGIVAMDSTLLGLEGENLDEIAGQRHQMNYHMFLAHATAVNLCHEILPGAKIAPVLSYITVYPASPKPEDVLSAWNAEDYMCLYLTDVYCNGEYPEYYLKFLEENGWMFRSEPGDAEVLKKAKPDYLGVNWYQSKCSEAPKEHNMAQLLMAHPELKAIAKRYSGTPKMHSFVKNPYVNANDWGWDIDPIGLRLALRKLEQRYHLPIMITENGLGHVDIPENGRIHDTYRIDYLREHIRQMELAMEEGVRVIGYHVWSFLDLISVNDGMEKRYGLVYVDRTDTELRSLARIPKDSYFWYKQCIAKGGCLDGE